MRSLRGYWLLILLFATACSPTSPDPAIGYYLRDQSSDYGGLARWAHQFMTEWEAINQLKLAGYACVNSKKKPELIICHDQGLDLWPGTPMVLLQVSKHNHRLIHAYGKRSLFGLTQSPLWESEKTLAPGLQFKESEHFSNFVADVIGPNSGSAYQSCAQTIPDGEDDEWIASHCPDWANQRKSGWKNWSGQVLPVESLQTVHAHLRSAGFICPDLALLAADPVIKAKLDDQYAWLTCHSRSLLGQPQRVLLGLDLETSQLQKIHLVLADKRFELPITPPPVTDEPGQRRVIVRNRHGIVKPLLLSLSAGKDFDFEKRLPSELDAASRKRLLQASAWQAKISLDAYNQTSGVPTLQQLDMAAYLFARLGNDTVREWPQTLPEQPLRVQAALIMAQCIGESAEQSRDCFKPYLINNPKLNLLFRQAVDEVKSYIAELAADHPAKKRVEILDSALLN